MSMGTADRMVCVFLWHLGQQNGAWSSQYTLNGTVVHSLPAGLSPDSFMDALSQVKSNESQFLILSRNKASLSSL